MFSQAGSSTFIPLGESSKRAFDEIDHGEPHFSRCSSKTLGSSKRSLDESEEPSAKRFCNNRLYIRLESETSEASQEDTESVLSIQDCITEFAEDTPDTDTKSEESYSSHDENNVFRLEYEPVSLSEEDIINTNLSSSNSEDILTTTVATGTVIYEKITGNQSRSTDVEDTEEDSITDSDKLRTKFWTCVQCKSRNNNPMYRYCGKCFQVRKNLFPPRPRRRRRRSKLFNSKKYSPRATPSLDSGIGSSKDSIPINYLDSKDDKNSIASTATSCSSTPNSQEIEGKQTSTETSLPEYKELCIICNVYSKDSIFLHGKIGHMCCCYKCAKRTWMTRKSCPVCNGRVSTIVKVFVT